MEFEADRIHSFYLDLHVDGAVDITACNINIREDFIFGDEIQSDALLPTGRSAPRTVGLFL
jgi:hypothetical protein